MKKSRCKHEEYVASAFYLMQVPICLKCGKKMQGKKAKETLDFYESLMQNNSAYEYHLQNYRAEREQ